MKFTGERVIPDQIAEKSLFFEHFARYMYAAQFVAEKCVLDLGCGTGYGSEYLATQQAKLVMGVDVDHEAINYAQTHYQQPNLIYATNNCFQVSLKDNLFDVVVSFEVIEHLEDCQSYLQEVKRVLTPGGYFIGSTPNKKLHSPDVESSHNPFHIREYYLNDLQAILSACFEKVWVLGQSPIEGFMISESLSLGDLVKDASSITAEPIVDKHAVINDIDNAKDFVFVCQKKSKDGSIIERRVPHKHSGLYIGESRAAQFMNVVTALRNQQNEIVRLNEQLVLSNHKLEGFKSGRFIKFMAFLNRFKHKLLYKTKGDIYA